MTASKKWKSSKLEIKVDSEKMRLDFARLMGADKTVNFMEYKGAEALGEGVKEAFGGSRR